MARLRAQLVDSPRHGPLPALLLGLTVVSGIVDAVSLLRLERVFVANMTGNVVFAGLGVAGVHGFSVGVALTALAAFVAGAGATSLIPARWRRDRARMLRSSVLVKGVLTISVMATIFAVGTSPDGAAPYLFTAALAVSMGVQNATVARLGVPELTTTVLTMNLTRLAADLTSPGRLHPDNLLRVAAVLTLFAGAAAGGALVLNVDTASALALAVAILAGVGIVADRAARRGAGWIAFPS